MNLKNVCFLLRNLISRYGNFKNTKYILNDNVIIAIGKNQNCYLLNSEIENGYGFDWLAHWHKKSTAAIY